MTKFTIHNYMQKKLVGASPLRKGRQTPVSSNFFELLATHVSIKQPEGQPEAKPRHLKTLMYLCPLCNTESKDADKKHIYTQFHKKHPHIVQSSKIMQVEESCGLWTTYGNLNKWFGGFKECLVYLIVFPLSGPPTIQNWPPNQNLGTPSVGSQNGPLKSFRPIKDWRSPI